MNVALIGSGSWGTVVAGLAAARAERVTMWAHSEQTVVGINTEHRNPRYLVDYDLPGNVVATTDLSQALDGAEAVIFAVPSTHLRSVCHQAAPFIADETPVLCLTKGIEPESGLLMSEVIASEIGNEARVAALSGPNHAEEICRGGLSAAVIASEDPQVGETFKDLLLSTAFRIYLSQDMTGVEVCGAMKNVIAIVCGISAGSGAGDNTLALIMTRGLAEISRLVHARGGQAMTCMGLAGMGDLIATCTSEHSRNRSFGVELAQGVLCPNEAREPLALTGYDYILGSVHAGRWREDYYWMDYRDPPHPLPVLIREYFENCLAVARWDQVDALAHLGYLKRYAIRDGVTLDYTPYDDLIDEILCTLIATGKALEVNTSGFRYGLPEWIPGIEIWRRYRAMGGELVTIGSDAHRPEDIGAGHKEAQRMLRELGFTRFFYFRARKPVAVEL